jgi:hypothetical protein
LEKLMNLKKNLPELYISRKDHQPQSLAEAISLIFGEPENLLYLIKENLAKLDIPPS